MWQFRIFRIFNMTLAFIQIDSRIKYLSQVLKILAEKCCRRHSLAFAVSSRKARQPQWNPYQPRVDIHLAHRSTRKARRIITSTVLWLKYRNHRRKMYWQSTKIIVFVKKKSTTHTKKIWWLCVPLKKHHHTQPHTYPYKTTTTAHIQQWQKQHNSNNCTNTMETQNHHQQQELYSTTATAPKTRFTTRRVWLLSSWVAQLVFMIDIPAQTLSPAYQPKPPKNPIQVRPSVRLRLVVEKSKFPFSQ
jgi:hypothetical protein